jgi:hypothetical protein
MNMIAERETEPGLAEVDSDTAAHEEGEEATVHSVPVRLERRATLRRPFVDDYQPRHRAESPAG